MGFVNYILSNYVMVFELIGLLLMLRISAHISARMKRLTVAVVALLVVESVLFRVEKWTQTFEKLSVARPMLTATIYTLYPIILVLVMRITSNKEFSKKKLIIMLIPVLAGIPLYYSSQWTKIIFWYTEENDYVGGPLSRWPYVIFGMYTILFLVHNFVYFKKYSRLNRLVATFIISGSMVGVLLYLGLSFSSDYTALFTSALVLYYLCIYIHMSRIDPLTSLLNRQSYYQDMKSFDDRITCVVSVDMNELKYYNDTFGHEAGDKALKVVSKVLWENCGKGGTVYRVGGDEFVIFYENTSEYDVKANIDVMRSRMAKTGYICAYGYSMKDKQESIDAVLSEADAKMYADKAETKKIMLEKGVNIHYREDFENDKQQNV